MTITRGDTPSWTIELFDENGGPYSLNGCTVTVTCKRRASLPDSEALFQHFIIVNALGLVADSSGMELGPGGAVSGVIFESITSIESTAFVPGTYKSDLEVRTSSGKVHTPLRGVEEVVLYDWTI